MAGGRRGHGARPRHRPPVPADVTSGTRTAEQLTNRERGLPPPGTSPPKTCSRPPRDLAPSSNTAACRVSNTLSGDCPGDERQHESRDDDRHPRVVQPVPALLLLRPAGGVA